jgi:CheY-like chemotaxis protein
MLDLEEVTPAVGARRVLVVDDHFDTAEVLTVMLEMLGHEARCAYRGLDAISIAHEWEPDLVLLDIGLPDVSGLQVARSLRSNPATADCRIVAITCWDTPDHVARSRSAGCDVHIAKPLGLDLLRRILATTRTHVRARPRAPSSSCDVHARVA